MASTSNQRPSIIKTERGLTISGTRVTLYDVLNYLKSEYPAELVRHKLNLTEQQLDLVLSYIDNNASTVETEYQEVLKTREEIYKYWQEQNQEHFAQFKKSPYKPEHQILWQKLEQQKANRLVSN